jgi:hypothetical protein
MTQPPSGVLGSERSKSEHSHPPTFIKRPATLARPPPHLIRPELTGRTPARTHSSHHSGLFHSPYACGASGQWFAGAGFSSSIGRVAHGGLRWKKIYDQSPAAVA